MDIESGKRRRITGEGGGEEGWGERREGTEERKMGITKGNDGGKEEREGRRLRTERQNGWSEQMREKEDESGRTVGEKLRL